MSNYRILLARSGYYYVQQRTMYGWSKVGGFFNTRTGARRLIRDRTYLPLSPRVVEYY